MSWGTDFTADIFLSHMNFDNIYQIDNKINELEINIQNDIAKLKMWASSNPNDITPKDFDEEKISYISSEIDIIIETLTDNNISLYNINLYKEYYLENIKDKEDKDKD